MLACALVLVLATVAVLVGRPAPSHAPRVQRSVPSQDDRLERAARIYHPEKRERAPAVLVASVEPSARTRELEARLTGALEDAALGDPLYDPNGPCPDLNSTDPRCLQALSNLFFSALADVAAEFVESNEHALASAVEEAGADDYVAGLTALYQQAPSRSAKLAALVLLRHTPGVPGGSLPEPVYLGLSETTDPEIQLVLAPHSSVRLPSEASARSVQALAADTSRPGRVRVDASRALGHPEQAQLLASLVANLKQEGRGTPLQLLGGLPIALAGCGEACADSIAILLRSDAKHERRIGLRALGLMPEGSLFVDQMLALFPPSFGDARAEMEFSRDSSIVAEL